MSNRHTAPTRRRSGPNARSDRSPSKTFIATDVPTIGRGAHAMLDAALAYAANGWPVFPCKPDKAPFTPHGFKDATTNTAVIRRWWSRWPSANIATPTGVVIDVLDVDVRTTGNGWPAFNRLKRSALLEGAVRMIRTPSNGLHVHFPACGASSGSIKGQFLDFKAAGGYVLLPPSIVVTEDYSGPYELLDERPGGSPLDWAACRRLLSPPRPRMQASESAGASPISALAQFVEGQREGNRNSALFWACCRAVEAGIPDLHELVEAGVRTGLGRAVAEATAKSAERTVHPS